MMNHLDLLTKTTVAMILAAVAIPAISLSEGHGSEVVSVNGSFEAQLGSITPTNATTFGQTFPSLTGWTKTGTGNLNLANGDTSGPPFRTGNGSTIPFRYATDGGTYLTFDTANYTLTQGITGLAANEPVNVSFDLIRLFANNNAPTGPLTAQVELFDGADATAAVLYNSGTINVNALAEETWTPFSSGALFNTGSDMFLRLTLIDNTGGALGGIDNLQVTATLAPEPSTMVLWLTAFVGLGLVGLRRAKAMRNRGLRQ